MTPAVAWAATIGGRSHGAGSVLRQRAMKRASPCQPRRLVIDLGRWLGYRACDAGRLRKLFLGHGVEMSLLARMFHQQPKSGAMARDRVMVPLSEGREAL